MLRRRVRATGSNGLNKFVPASANSVQMLGRCGNLDELRSSPCVKLRCFSSTLFTNQQYKHSSIINKYYGTRMVPVIHLLQQICCAPDISFSANVFSTWCARLSFPTIHRIFKPGNYSPKLQKSDTSLKCIKRIGAD